MRFQPSSRRETRKGTIVPGLILGLVIGLAMAAFIAWTWNKEPTYNERVRTDQERLRSEQEREGRNEKGEAAPSKGVDERPITAPEAPPPAKVSPEDRERFDFYKILPGIEEARPVNEEERKREDAQLDELLQKEKLKDDKKKPRNPEDEDQLNNVINKIQQKGEVSDQEAPRAKPVKRWLLQAGAFENEDEAERLKASLAMAGMEARVIRSKDSHDQPVFRVRLGPFTGDTEVEQARAELRRQGIKATSIPLKEGRL